MTDTAPADKPRIFVFADGGSPGLVPCVALAEDGTVLGSHMCSHEEWARNDLGVLPGSRPDRHVYYAEHYPQGYEMEFVPRADIQKNPRLLAAIERANAAAENDK